MTVGQRIRNRRRYLGLSVDEIAAKLGKNRATVYRYESNEIENLPITVLEPLADILKTTPAYLMGWTNDPNDYDRIEKESGIATPRGCESDYVKSYLDDENTYEESNILHPTGVVPIIGTIPAGIPIIAQQNIEGYMPVMSKNPEEYFYLRVKGDSMINANINDGSLVLVHEQNTAENGDIIACRINGDEATLKRFKQIGDTVVLLPENPNFEPIIVSCKDFNSGYAQIIGVAKQVITNL